ncbi:MAG: hypothetical protein EU529_01650 [Promethearchaeota archaeon]|nr:MAG: hypothetical protein EU529_01650 [Candidatus Lokiarchaeota archaeon]
MSKDLLLYVYKRVKESGIINKDLIKYLETIFPNKSQDALEVIKRGIKKNIYKPSNRTVWTAMGENDEYLIYPKLYCSCQDFYKNVVVKKKRIFCKHLLAQTICEALNNYHEIEIKDIEFKKFIQELKLKE